MRVRGLVLSAVILAMPAALDAQGLTIEHAAVGCVVAGTFPRFEARIDPAASVARALVHFRSESGQPWYAVAMKAPNSYLTLIPILRAVPCLRQ